MPSLLFRRLTIETLSVHMFNHRINKFFELL